MGMTDTEWREWQMHFMERDHAQLMGLKSRLEAGNPIARPRHADHDPGDEDRSER